MKLARTFLPLFLLTLLLSTPHGANAQTPQDVFYVSVEKGADLLWHFSFKHTGPSQSPVNRFVLIIDTIAYPNLRFGNAAIQSGTPAASSLQNWTFFGVSNNADSAFWCNENYFIQAHTGSDSSFEFTLQPFNSQIPLYDSTFTIQWYAQFAANSCSTFSPVSSGTIQLTATSFQGFSPLDTVTATASTPLCDPVFNFTVYNRNIFRTAISQVSFQVLNQTVGAIRPAAVSAPIGWTVDSVTSQYAYFRNVSGGGIPSHNALGNFLVALRANPLASAFSFVWRAYDNFGTLIDRDTMLNIPATPAQCSLKSTQDTLLFSPKGGCAANLTLENFHSGDASLTPSRITKLVLNITTPGVTFASATKPTQAGICWSYGPPPPGSQTLTFFTPSYSCGQASATLWTYGIEINDPHPGEAVTVQWSDSSGAAGVSNGSVIIRCEAPPTPDALVAIDAEGSCCYRAIVKNAHTPTSNIHAVTLIMPDTAGAFSNAAGSYSSNTGWTGSFGSGNTSLQFTAGGGTGLIPGAVDTFYFCTVPKKPQTSFPIRVLTKEAKTDDVKMDTTVKNVPGCTPPVFCDSVHHLQSKPGSANCDDTIFVFNRRGSSTVIDSVIVTPMNGRKIASAHAPPQTWTTTVTPDSVVFAGSIPAAATGVFTVSYASGVAATFGVQVQTIDATGRRCTMDSTMSCQSSGVGESTSTPLALSVAPNPLNDRTDIRLTTSTYDAVHLVLLDILGRSMQSVFNGSLTPGDHTFSLDASSLAPGTYYLRLETDGERLTKKIVVQR